MKFDGEKVLKGSTVQEAIRSRTLELLINNKGDFFTTDQIRDYIIDKQPMMMDSTKVLHWLAKEHGIKGKISSAISSLKNGRENQFGHPIVSSDEKGKGYSYLDPDDENTPDFWDDMFTARNSREEKPKKEKKTLDELFKKTLKNCENPKVRGRLKKLAKKHKVKVKA